MEDAHVFCTKCGKKEVQTPVAPQPVTPPPVAPPPVAPPQPTVSAEKKVSKQKKSKAPLIIGICSGLAVVGVTIGILFAMGIISFPNKDGDKIVAVNVDTPAPAEEQPTMPEQETETEPEEEADAPVTDQQIENDTQETEDTNEDDDLDEEPQTWTKKYADSYVYPARSTEYKLDTKWLTKKDIKKILKLKELEGLSKYNKINVVLQTMYAENGYIHGSATSKNPNKAMKRFFKTKDWYHGETDDLNHVEGRFNKTERHNSDILAKYRKRFSDKNAQSKLDEFLDDKEYE